MDGSIQLRADLDFSVDLTDRSGRAGPITGTVRADGSDVVVRFSRTPSLGGSGTRPLVRPLAEQLATAGLTIYLVDPSGPLLRLGAGVRAPRWQSFGTGSRRIQVHSVSALRRSLGGPRVFEAALPTAFSLPAPRQARGALRSVWRRLTGRRR